MSTSDDEDEWRFAVEDVGEDAETETAADAAEQTAAHDADTEGEDGDDFGGNVAGSLSPTEGLEPGEPTAENALFVALGALTTIVLILVVSGVI